LETPEFSQALADRVSWLVDKDMGAAKLQINPPQLGPIEVRVEVQGDKAQVWLSAHSVVTRDVLDASSPKLREMLGSQGFSQVSVDISQRSFQDRPPPPPRFDWTPAAANSSNEALFTSADSRAPRVKLGALDAYA
jgi:flagellar hook-length control protein FliK